MKTCKRCGKEIKYGNWCGGCRVAKARIKRKQVLVEHKGGKCEICGYDGCIDALEFHHIDPSTKKRKLSNGNPQKLEKDLEEVDKCILTCANCHREIHAKLKGA